MLHSFPTFSVEKVQFVNRDQTARLDIRNWLLRIMEELNVSAIKLAEMTGTSPNTIYRALDLGGEFMPTMKTLMKIADKTGYFMPASIVGGMQVEHIKPKSASSLKHFDVSNLLVATAEQNRRSYRISDRSLELEGYLPGDIVVVDPDVTPSAGDIVCAEVSGYSAGAQDTVLRLYEPPYLLARSIDRNIEAVPLLIGKGVTIVGTAVQMIRDIRGLAREAIPG